MEITAFYANILYKKEKKCKRQKPGKMLFTVEKLQLIKNNMEEQKNAKYKRRTEESIRDISRV